MSSVDVIIPCYRYGHYLRECVESILAERKHSVRVLIIDDASPDNTAEVAAELVAADPRVTFIRHLTNKGHIATYNEGIEWVSADYMLLLSADDYLLPNALGRAIELLDSDPELGFVFGKVIRSAESGIQEPSTRDLEADIPMKGQKRSMAGLQFIELIAAKGSINFIPTPTAVVRTALQKRLGGYLPELPHSGDMEMWLRFAAHSSVGWIDEFQAVYRQHGQNMQLEYYEAKRQLPDLEQRRMAIQCFYESCKQKLPDPRRTLEGLLRPVAIDALCLANEAFNHGDVLISEQLAAFAVDTAPATARTWHWRFLKFKRRVGYRAWRMMYPLIAWAR